MAIALSTVALTSVAVPARADTADVTIANTAFSPETVTVKATGGEPEEPGIHAHVNFRMDDRVEHTVLFDDPSVAGGSSGRLSFGQVYSVLIEAPGTYDYRCEIHPNMTGTIVVTAPENPAVDEEEAEKGDGSGTNLGVLVAVAALAAGTGAAVVLLVQRRRRNAGSQQSGTRATRRGGS